MLLKKSTIIEGKLVFGKFKLKKQVKVLGKLILNIVV